MASHLEKPRLWKLIVIFSFTNVLAVLISSALPEIGLFFHITKATTQNVVSIYLLGCFLGQFLYAPFMNAVGKQKTLQGGLVITILGSILCLISIELKSFNFLLIGRLITAIGSGLGPVLVLAVMNDFFSQKEIKKIFSLLSTIFILVPAISVLLGGLITAYISWIGCFYLIFFYAFVVLLLSRSFIDIVSDIDFNHFHPVRVFKSFYQELSNSGFAIFTIISACASCFMIVFISEVPFIAVKILKMNPSSYGFYSLIPNFAMLLGGVISSYGTLKFKESTCIGVGSLFLILISGFLGAFFYFQEFTKATVFLLPSLFFIFSPLIVTNARVCANSFGSDRSYAASCLYIISYFVMFLTIVSMHLLKDLQFLAMPVINCVLSFLVFFLWIGSRFLYKSNKM